MSQKIIDLVTAVVAPAIPEPYELVDIEYEKLGGDYVLSVFASCPASPSASAETPLRSPCVPPATRRRCTRRSAASLH